MSEPALRALMRWEQAGAHWRLLTLTATAAEVELLTCTGEPVDRLRSADAELLAYLQQRTGSED